MDGELAGSGFGGEAWSGDIKGADAMSPDEGAEDGGGGVSVADFREVEAGFVEFAGENLGESGAAGEFG